MARQREEITLPFIATPKQLPFVQSTAMYRLGGGARGGGKSHCLAGIGVLLSFLFPGNTGYCGRADLTDFERTTLPLLLSLIPPKLLLTHNSQKHFIDILSCDGHTPSRIWYGPLSEPGNILSGNYGWFFIDEAYEVPLETFINLTGCLRGTLPSGQSPPFCGLLGSNPSPGWLLDTFPVLPEEQQQYEQLVALHPDLDWEPVPSVVNPKKTIDPDYAYFHFNSADNPFNGAGYTERLVKQYSKLGAEFVSRFVYGVWDATMAGLVYQLEDSNLWTPRYPGESLYSPGTPVVLGGDPSNGAGVYALVALQVRRGQLRAIDCFAKLGGIDEDARDWLETRPWKDDIEDGVFDPAKPDSIKRLVGWGYPVRGLTKRKNVSDQINAVKSKMAVDEVTRTSEFIMDATRCAPLVEEMRKRVWRNPSRRNPDARIPEQPVKAWDHVINATEYVVYERWPFGLPSTTGTSQQRVRQQRAYFNLA